MTVDKNICGKLLNLGYPVAFQNTVIFVGGMIVQSVVNKFGVVFIAGFTATNKLYGILEVAATSYGHSMTTYAGQNLGAGNTGRIRQGVRSTLVISLFTSVTISAFMLIFGQMILGWFISGDLSQVEATLAVAYRYLAIMSLFLPVLYVLYTVRSTLQGIGDTIMPMVSGCAEFIMRVGAVLLLPLVMGQDGIFYAEILAWAGAVVVLVSAYFYHVNKWNKA